MNALTHLKLYLKKRRAKRMHAMAEDYQARATVMCRLLGKFSLLAQDARISAASLEREISVAQRKTRR